MRGNEMIAAGLKLHPVRCYDNGGKTADRYTVVYMGLKYKSSFASKSAYESVGMSVNPFHPQGIGQHGTAMVGKHLGKRIPFATLPSDCQDVVIRDLGLEAKC